MSDATYEAQELLQSHTTMATVIHAMLRKKYGEDVYGWDLTTIAMEVKDDFKVDIASHVMERFAAIQTLMTSDVFFTRLDAFMAICNAFSTGDPCFQIFDPVTVEEAAWGISEASLNREFLPFAPAIRKYLKQVLDTDGYTYDAPDVFDLVLQPDKDITSLRTLLLQIHQSENRSNVEEYIDTQLRDIVTQFNKIPTLATVDDLLLNNPKIVVGDL